MSLYEFAERLSGESAAANQMVTSVGREDANLEAKDQFGRMLKGRKPIVYKLKSLAKKTAVGKYPQGSLVNGVRINRNLFGGVHPWTYPEWANQVVEPLENNEYEIIGYLDQTYPSGRYVRGHLYMVVAEHTSEYEL